MSDDPGDRSNRGYQRTASVHHDPELRVHLVRSPTTGVTRESVPPVPEEISALMREVSAEGKLVE
ncbi:hypothetical protein ACFP51_11795 [Streptomyces pratens]|uniref:Uncharacterized protein n=1 Tax=Streptomyces pratens TaxID=887456 RepID=A0ABW1LVW9_9ACTN